jgi:hypothetical protein
MSETLNKYGLRSTDSDVMCEPMCESRAVSSAARPETGGPIGTVGAHSGRDERGSTFTVSEGVGRSAAHAIGPITPGVRVLAFGTFPPLDVLAHLLDATGPADVDVCTWTPGRRAFEQAALWRAGRIGRLRMLTDRSLVSRNPAYHATLLDLYGPASVAFAPIHAKFATVTAPGWSLAVLTSANFDEVRSVEFYAVLDDELLAAALTRLVDGYFAAGDPLPATAPGRAGDGALSVDVRRAGWSHGKSGLVLA